MTVLLERDTELDAIRTSLAAVGGGDGKFVLIEGPAGIGKTALLTAARGQAHDAGLRVLSGAGAELEREFPYGVIRQLFSATLAQRSEADRLLTGAAGLARPVLEPGRHQARGEQGSHLLEALHGLYWLVANLAATSPVLLTIDDVHWCDGPSLRFLIYMQRRLEGLPVLILAAARRGEPGADERLIGMLGADARSGIVQPHPLSEDAVAELLRAGLGEEPEPTFTAAALAATAGNPFLLRELITALLELGLPPTAAAAGRIGEVGSDGVRRAILRRLARLGEDAIALARATAVLGSGREPRDTAELAGLTERATAQIAAALVRAQILQDERRLAFVHPLVRAAVYLDIPVPARARDHARAARILARRGADDDAVAAHLLETGPAGDQTVVRHLQAAARGAAAKGAMDVAATYLRRALAEPPAANRRGGVLRELGAAELAAGQPDAAAERLAAAATEADSVDARVSIVLMRRHALVLADRIGEAVEVVDEVRRDARDPALRDLLEGGAVGAGHLDLAVVRAMHDRVDALQARAVDPTLREPLALAVAACAAAFANRPVTEVAALAERAIEALPELHPDSAYSFEGQLAIALLLAEQYDRLMELASAWLDRARRRGSLPQYTSMAFIRSNCAYRSGALTEAEADARDALEAARLHGHHFWLPGAVAALINPLIERGQTDEADAMLADTQVAELHGTSSAWGWTAMLLPARGRLHLAQGRLGEGVADLLACGERLESAGYRSPSLATWRSEAALALATLGEHARARVLASEEVQLARRSGAPRAIGVALRVAGMVTGGDSGLELLHEATTVLAGSAASLEHARALADLGSALRRAGSRVEARRPLRQAVDLAVRCGAVALGERAREELLATGAHPRRDRLTGTDALTPSEHRVARMAAEGRSNPEIAQELFLTRRTVETHLTHAYQKLGIGSREELAAAL